MVLTYRPVQQGGFADAAIGNEIRGDEAPHCCNSTYGRGMGIEVTGRLHTIFATQQVSERFTKREFVVEMADNSKYPQTVLFQLTGDRCNQLDGLEVGAEVRVDFSLRGREWKSPKGETKYFNSLDVWKVESNRAGASSGGARRGANSGGGRSNTQSGMGGGLGSDPRDGADVPRGDDDYRPGTTDNDDIPF
jgi:single-stranded DNA-binding protein